jgi:hypothetical protein
VSESEFVKDLLETVGPTWARFFALVSLARPTRRDSVRVGSDMFRGDLSEAKMARCSGLRWVRETGVTNSNFPRRCGQSRPPFLIEILVEIKFQRYLALRQYEQVPRYTCSSKRWLRNKFVLGFRDLLTGCCGTRGVKVPFLVPFFSVLSPE